MVLKINRHKIYIKICFQWVIGMHKPVYPMLGCSSSEMALLRVEKQEIKGLYLSMMYIPDYSVQISFYLYFHFNVDSLSPFTHILYICLVNLSHLL